MRLERQKKAHSTAQHGKDGLSSVAAEALRTGRASSVLHVGCGDGKLLTSLAEEGKLRRMGGCDVSESNLRLAEKNAGKTAQEIGMATEFFLGSAFYRDDRFFPYDAVVITLAEGETDGSRLSYLERIFFRFARSRLVIILTECAAFQGGRMAEWARNAASGFGYRVAFPAGDKTAGHGKIAVFERKLLLPPPCSARPKGEFSLSDPDRSKVCGPFDFIGDIHGCFDELTALLKKLGYALEKDRQGWRFDSPSGRLPVFVGDLVDRGPKVLASVRLVRRACEEGKALCVKGNHDAKLSDRLSGIKLFVNKGMERSFAELMKISKEERSGICRFLGSLPSHLVLDGGKVVAAHAGLREQYHGVSSKAEQDFALFGDRDKGADTSGFPIRDAWAREYGGKALVVYGHTPHTQPYAVNHTVNIDTGCVYGGKLTAYRYPEAQFVSVPAESKYWIPLRQEELTPSASVRREDDLPEASDVLGEKEIRTPQGVFKLSEKSLQNAFRAVCAAVAPPWLIYLPESGRNETDIFVVAENTGVAARRFQSRDGRSGVCYGSGGLPKYPLSEEKRMIERIRTYLAETGFFRDMKTGWVCFAAKGKYADGKFPAIAVLATEGKPRFHESADWQNETVSRYFAGIAGSGTDSAGICGNGTGKAVLLKKETLRLFSARRPLWRVHSCMAAAIASDREQLCRQEQNHPNHKPRL